MYIIKYICYINSKCCRHSLGIREPLETSFKIKRICWKKTGLSQGTQRQQLQLHLRRDQNQKLEGYQDFHESVVCISLSLTAFFSLSYSHFLFFSFPNSIFSLYELSFLLLSVYASFLYLNLCSSAFPSQTLMQPNLIPPCSSKFTCHQFRQIMQNEEYLNPTSKTSGRVNHIYQVFIPDPISCGTGTGSGHVNKIAKNISFPLHFSASQN